MSDVLLEVQTAPSTPAASNAIAYFDSTLKRLASINDAGTVSNYADLASTQSLSGKTLTSPTITGAVSTTGTYNSQTLLENSNSASQSLAAADTYVTGTAMAIPAAGLVARSWFRFIITCTKNATGTSTPIVIVRFGTNGSTADTARLTFTFAATTAVVDGGIFEVFVNVVALSASVGVIQGTCRLMKNLTTNTGFSNVAFQAQILFVTSGNFDNTVANSILGVSINPGTGTYTVLNVQSDSGKI